MRPTTLEEVVGQDHILGEGALIPRSIATQNPLSLLLWGPPGCGKTTIARLYAKAFSLDFYRFSAVFSKISEIKELIQKRESHPLIHSKFVLFIDEIHRFNKAQQDAFLPFIEDGTLILLGATTENPSFYLNSALLSRLRVLKCEALSQDHLESLLKRYEVQHKTLSLSPTMRAFLLKAAQGDGRYLLNLIENLEGKTVDDEASLLKLLPKRVNLYDKEGDSHYNLISALHKAVRGSDPDAALYWFTRMLKGGEDPLYLGRRLIRMATEDIGLADPTALPLAINAFKAYEILGSPEGELALAETVLYLALAPKSNSTYVAFGEAEKVAEETGHLSPPNHILNAPTSLMKEIGYSQGYQYDHDCEEGFSGQNYFPKEMERLSFYKPVKRGFEREMQKRLSYFEKLRKK